jgi:hypothetical protein
MSLSDPGNLSNALNFATLANPARAFYGAASTPSSGVSQIVAGSGITVSPAGGTGVVTVSSSGSSSSAVGMVSNARVPYQQQVENIPGPVSAGTNGVVGVTCPVGNVTTGGYATFSCILLNTDPTNTMDVRLGIFTGTNTPPLNVIDECLYTKIPVQGGSVVVSRTFPLVNMTGDFIVQGFVVTGVPGAQINNFVRNPTLSVTWGGNATIEVPP